MECKASDSKKLFKVFDASRRKRSKNKGYDDSNSIATDNSQGERGNLRLVTSAKASLQDVSAAQGDVVAPEASCSKRDRESSPSVSPVPDTRHRSPRHRRHFRDQLSLALKPRQMSTPRSNSPPPNDAGAVADSPSPDQDSLIYAFLEEAFRRDKKKQRRAHKHEERRVSGVRDTRPSLEREPRSPREGHGRERDRGRERERQREPSLEQERRHHHHRHRRDLPDAADGGRCTRNYSPEMDQAKLLKTFAEFCTQLAKSRKIEPATPPPPPTPPSQITKEIQHCQSHKSLQCEVLRDDSFEVEQRAMKLRDHERSWENLNASRIRSQDVIRQAPRYYSPDRLTTTVEERRDKVPYFPPYDKGLPKYASKLELVGSRMHHDIENRHLRDSYEPNMATSRSCTDHHFRQSRYHPEHREFREADERREQSRARAYEEERRRAAYEQKVSRSYDVHREEYDDDRGRRTVRSDSNRRRGAGPREVKHLEGRPCRDTRYHQSKDRYYDQPPDTRDRHTANLPSKDRRSKRNMDRYELASVVSKEEDFREKDHYSERERDSGFSIADENSTVSGRSNCLRVVKQEIAEQREAMDKMMKLWKDLMRCFKTMQTSNTGKAVNESAATVQESAAAQLQLWRECMRRYETVARDVGDTDAKLMEEINKQRSEMAEMSGMWQECLQRYRDMSNDFNNLKDKLAKSESPMRPVVTPLVCAEGEGSAPPAPYRLPPQYPQMPAMGMGYGGGSPLRSRASAPPAWWWCGEPQPTPRRRSSPDSRGSRERRHRHKERDDSRHKEKPKPNGARSEHKHRKR